MTITVYILNDHLRRFDPVIQRRHNYFRKKRFVNEVVSRNSFPPNYYYVQDSSFVQAVHPAVHEF